MSLRCGTAALLTLLFGALVPVTLRADEPTSRPAFLFATDGRLAVSDYSLEDLSKMYPAFEHAPLDSAGFNALVMPIHYQDSTGDGDPNEAYAFSFLLSNALDWAPGSYCARHTFFICERSPAMMRLLASQYDPPVVSKAIRSWQSTHAVGGTLIKSKDGYSGTLEIFDPSGKQADRESFDKPRAYFDLLGDMAAAAMKFFGEPANDALVKHLKVPRCKDPQTLALLGSAAYMTREQMLDVADDILKTDPGFSELRLWAATQRYWIDRDAIEDGRQQTIALNDYLTEEGLRTFERSLTKDLPAARWDTWWEKAASLCPEDSPLLVMHALQDSPTLKDLSEHALDVAVRSSGKYPNDYYLLSDSQGIFATNHLGRFDGDLAISMLITALQNNFMTGDGTKDHVLYQLAIELDDQGRPDIAVQMLSAVKGEMEPYPGFVLMDALCDLGQFKLALKYFQALPPAPPRLRGQAAFRAIWAATMLGNAKEAEEVVQHEQAALDQAHILPLCQACIDCLHGRGVDAAKLAPSMADTNARIQILQLLAQLDLDAGEEKYRDEIFKQACAQPGARPFLILLDAYDRKIPRPEMADMYRTMEWLLPDDPWAVKAASDGLERHAGSPAVNVAAVADGLKSFPPHPRTRGEAPEDPKVVASISGQITPWKVAASVRLLTEQSDFQAAVDLARRYTNFIAGTDNPTAAFWPNHIAHLVEQRQAAAQAKQ